MTNDSQLIKLSVGAVVFKDDQVLIIKRGKAPFKDHYSIPGGKVDFGEKLEDAVKREIMEETGVEIELIGLIDVFEALPHDGGRFGASPQVRNDNHYVMVDYVAKWVSGDPAPADDAIEAEFVPYPEALSRLAWDKTRQAVASARTALNRHK